MNTQVLNATPQPRGGYKVDVSRGERIGRVSSEWFSRPDDERFLSLTDLARTVGARSERSRTRTVESARIHVEASRNDPERLSLILPGAEAPVAPTHWSFGQLASLVGAPATYLRQLPAPLAGINLQYGLANHRAEQVKTFEADDGRVELTETTVPSADKRALFVGLEAYEAAGGPVLRDLFSDDDGGWLEDVGLLDRLVTEKLHMLADELASHGWKWIEAAVELPYGYANGLRKIGSVSQELTEEERAGREALRKEYDDLEAAYSDADELPDEVDQRFSEIEAALAGFENRPAIFEPDEVARAGVFLTINRDGELVVDRGYVRPEDEAPLVIDGEDSGSEGDDPEFVDGTESFQRTAISIGGQPVDVEEEDDGVIKLLPERLVGQLTAHRTLALQQALAENAHVAMTALLHRMVMERYSYSAPTGCLEISVRHRYLASQGSDLAESPSAKAIDERYEAWKTDIPSDEGALWDWIADLDDASRMALLAHCVSYGVNALYERPNDHSAAGPSQHSLVRRLAGADRLARATGLDMVVDAGWRPTVANYLGIVTKAHILAAVREGAGDRAASLIEHLKKGDMATQAERLLADTGWLPEPLRTPHLEGDAVSAETHGEDEALPEFLIGDDADAADEGEDHHLVAAE